MKKNILSKAGVLAVALMFVSSPITVSASSQLLTDPLIVKEQDAVENAADEYMEDSTSGPLTPEGNLTLVDDYGSTQGAGKQFITVETKNGQYFYIIIDRDANGTETVHFLNKVDEADLLAVMEEEDVQEYLSQSEKSESVPTDTEDMREDTENEQTSTEEDVPEVVGLPPLTSLLLIGGVIGIGGIGGYFYLKKNKKTQPVDASAGDEEDEEIPADLDETEFDDEDLDVDEEE